MAKDIIVLLSLMAFSFFYIAVAYDPQGLQDLCVGDFTSPVRVNGYPCKNPGQVTVDDFLFTGLHIPGNTSNPFGGKTTLVNVDAIPGLNTLGMTTARVDLGPGGVNPPHVHPRSSEIVSILEGTVLAGFVTSYPENKLFSKILTKGDVFVIPMGLVHFQFNVGSEPSVALNFLNSQTPGAVFIPSNIFGSNPPISDDVLAKAFLVDKSIVDEIQSKF